MKNPIKREKTDKKKKVGKERRTLIKKGQNRTKQEEN